MHAHDHLTAWLTRARLTLPHPNPGGDEEGEAADAAAAEAAPWVDDGSLPVDGAGALPFFFLDAHEEATTPDRLFLFGKARAAPAPCMRQRSVPTARPLTCSRKHTSRPWQRLCDELRTVPAVSVHWRMYRARCTSGGPRVWHACRLGPPEQAPLPCKKSKWFAVSTHSQAICTCNC
jgi:hypothetical protein